jgi:hypothetical protein
VAGNLSAVSVQIDDKTMHEVCTSSYFTNSRKLTFSSYTSGHSYANPATPLEVLLTDVS